MNIVMLCVVSWVFCLLILSGSYKKSIFGHQLYWVFVHAGLLFLDEPEHYLIYFQCGSFFIVLFLDNIKEMGR